MSRGDVDTYDSMGRLTPLESRTIQSASRNSSSGNLNDRMLSNGSLERLEEISRASSTQPQPLNPLSLFDGQPQSDGGSSSCSGSSTPEVDAQILEALKSKDRLFVLKLGEQMEALIRERHSRSRTTLSPENPYQRLLVHRCAGYYKLMPETEPSSREKSSNREMIVIVTAESRIPARSISELVPVEQIHHPTFKIMQRTNSDRRRQKPAVSRPESVTGEDGDLSDPEPSESGSMGSRSTTSRKHKTIAEREAAYQEARSRIFMDFEGKEKAKEQDTSASSSTFSLASASGSGSNSGGCAEESSEIDDNASTVPTESEWSAPITGRRMGGDSGMSSAGSTRSYQSGSSLFDGQNCGSGQASGTVSPGFSFPSLHDPTVPPPGYEHYGYPPAPNYVPQPYPYPYSPQGACPVPAPGQPYIPHYAYYPPYHYINPHHQNAHPISDPASPAAGPADAYPQPPAPYMGPVHYRWGPPTLNSQNQSASVDGHPPSVPGQHQVPAVNRGPLPPIYASYGPYIHAPIPVAYGTYPSYFQPPPQTQPPVMHPHPHHYVTNPSLANGGTPDQSASSGASSPSPTLSRRSISNGISSSNQQQRIIGDANKRATHHARGSWSYGPGVGSHMNTNRGMRYIAGSNGVGETIGPRLSAMTRRNTSNNRGDETVSTTSSASSSSSRQTFMSTPSKHPLPARPDWAAGMKAQPTLHPMRSKQDNNNPRNAPISRPASSPRVLNVQQSPQALQLGGTPQQSAPIFLHATDFPPLSVSNTATERRPSISTTSGAWSNMNSCKVLSPTVGQPNYAQASGGYGTALFNHGQVHGQGTGRGHPGSLGRAPVNGVMVRLDDDERGFERPPPKSAELYNPKGSKRPQQQQQQSSPPNVQLALGHEKEDKGRDADKEKDRVRGETVANAVLSEKVGALQLGDVAFAGEGASNGNGKMNGMSIHEPIADVPNIQVNGGDERTAVVVAAVGAV